MKYLDIRKLFTFQYVSINTRSRRILYTGRYTLHSNMFLLIRVCTLTVNGTEVTLHSNMFLLIQYGSGSYEH